MRRVGTNWYRGDLHVHTPFSANYRQEGVSASSLLKKFQALDFVVIADHNTFEGYEYLLEHTVVDSPVLFPGVELLLPGGYAGISLLAILNPRLSPADLEQFLRRLGMEERHRGNPDAILPGPLQAIADTLQEFGAIVIWTGCDSQAGIFRAVDEKQRETILNLNWPGNLYDWNQTGSSALEGKATVYSSNAHCLAEIGQLTTLLKMEKLDFAGLKFALINPGGRVLPGNSVEQLTHPHVISIEARGGFLNEEFCFNPGLNCLVGARGAGKTTLLSLLNFVLGGSEGEDLKTLVGPGEIRVKLFDGTECLEVRRKLGQAPTVLDRFGCRRKVDLKGFACFYSQGEIERVVVKPEVQLELLDRIWDSGQVLKRQSILKDALVENSRALSRLEQEWEQLEETLVEKPALEHRMKELKNYPLGEIQEKLAIRDRELLSLAGAREFICSQQKLLRNFPVIGVSKNLPEFLAPVLEQSRQMAKAVLRVWQQAEEELASYQAQVDAKHRGIDEEYQTLLGGFVDSRVKELVRERERLQTQLVNLEPALLRKEEISLQIKEVKLERMRLLNEWRGVSEKIYLGRKAVAEQINLQLQGVIRVEVEPEGSHGEYQKYLGDALQSLGVSTAKSLAKKVKRAELLDFLANGDIGGLAEKCGLSGDYPQRIISLLKSSKIMRGLETLDLPDLVTIYLRDGETEKAGSQLSTGQRCTAVLPLLLMAVKPPLIIDQPEDQLDNSYVYEVMVQRLRQLKEERQFIFATHNPNIPVLADAEQILVLQSDGRQGGLIAEGSIENPYIKELIQRIMEGGKDAFTRRARFYGQLAP